jgi:hypothetical protein
MTGHEQILEMRMRGYSPEQVWVTVFNTEPEYFPGTHPSLNLQNGFSASVDVTPRDRGALDFRCLVGLVVHLFGTDENRVMQVLRHIERAGPSRVITSTPNIFIDSAFKELSGIEK